MRFKVVWDFEKDIPVVNDIECKFIDAGSDRSVYLFDKYVIKVQFSTFHGFSQAHKEWNLWKKIRGPHKKYFAAVYKLGYIQIDSRKIWYTIQEYVPRKNRGRTSKKAREIYEKYQVIREAADDNIFNSKLVDLGYFDTDGE